MKKCVTTRLICHKLSHHTIIDHLDRDNIPTLWAVTMGESQTSQM